MGWWSNFINALNPCVHQWTKIDMLHDDPDDPGVTTIINQCDICGDIDTVTIQGPPKRPKPMPPHNCTKQGHRWKTFETINLVDQHNKVDGKPSAKGKKLLQECTVCGDTRMQVVGLSPAQYPNYGLPYPKDYTPPKKAKGDE